MNAPDPPHWTLNSRFAAFHTIWVHLEPLGCLTKLGAKRAELELKFGPRSRIGIFATNALDPPHWTLNSRFGAFCTIWVQFGPLSCLTKLGAKRAELVQKFVPRSRVGDFRDERTRSTPLHPKLSFCCISYRLAAFATIRLPFETRGKTFRTSAKVRATKTRQSFS